jgi:RNA polymerase sigma-70 factor (sigma-E family)
MKRDEADFAAFVAARQRSLQGTAWLLTRDWGAAEDLVSQALAKTWLHWSRIQRRDQPQVYTCRVMLRLHASQTRRFWSRERPHDVLPEPAAGDEMAARVAIRRTVLDALARLPRRQREIVVLRFFEDLTESQTAAVLDIAVGTVKSATAAALANLRRDPRLDSDQEAMKP